MPNLGQKEFFDWRLRGSIYLWMYNDGPKSVKNKWQFTYDGAGEVSFQRLLELLIKAEEGTRKTIVLTHPRNCTFFPVDAQRWNFETWDKLVITKSGVDEICLKKQETRTASLALGGESLLNFAAELKRVSSQNERVIGTRDGSVLIMW
jgi:hypothetical protein